MSRNVRIRRTAGAFIVTGCLIPVAESAAGQEPTVRPAEASAEVAERCSDPKHREFDFWLGEWEVRNVDGELVGHNTITRVARGCGLLEEWRGLRGGRGMSINTYDVDREQWTQRWVGDGATLWLEGGVQDGRMVLTGTAPRATPRGGVLDRISWTPQPDGRVTQLWEVSPDRGRSWQPVFEGYYARTPDDHTFSS